MVRTKQTKCGGSSTRPVVMQAATFSDQPEADQFEDIPEEDWPDMDKPPQDVGEGEASKSAGETGEGEGSKAVGKPTATGAEGGAEAPPDTAQATTVNPPMDPQPGTSKDNSQAPTNTPHDPQDENKPGLVEYVRSYQQTAKIWFDTVQASKEQA